MKLVNTADLKSAPLWVAGSSPAASNLYHLKERWLSGQRHLTVNQTTFVYVGSNPALSNLISKYKGQMAEWSKAFVLKASVLTYRGFESLFARN